MKLRSKEKILGCNQYKNKENVGVILRNWKYE